MAVTGMAAAAAVEVAVLGDLAVLAEAAAVAQVVPAEAVVAALVGAPDSVGAGWVQCARRDADLPRGELAKGAKAGC